MTRLTQLGYTTMLLEFAAIRETHILGEKATSERLGELLERSPGALAHVGRSRRPDTRLDSDGVDAWAAREMFPQVLRGALFLAAHSALEQCLKTLCEWLRDGDGGRVRLRDLRHTGIEGARVYMRRVLSLDFPDDTSTWAQVRDLAHLRNQLVHSGSFIRKADSGDRIQAVIGRLRYVALVGNDEIYLERAFLPDVLLVYEQLIGDVYTRNGIDVGALFQVDD